ncbi:MAG: hypothetical protein ACYDBV_04930 [Nitrospiria bacterium]
MKKELKISESENIFPLAETGSVKETFLSWENSQAVTGSLKEIMAVRSRLVELGLKLSDAVSLEAAAKTDFKKAEDLHLMEKISFMELEKIEAAYKEARKRKLLLAEEIKELEGKLSELLSLHKVIEQNAKDTVKRQLESTAAETKQAIAEALNRVLPKLALLQKLDELEALNFPPQVRYNAFGDEMTAYNPHYAAQKKLRFCVDHINDMLGYFTPQS